LLALFIGGRIFSVGLITDIGNRIGKRRVTLDADWWLLAVVPQAVVLEVV